MFYLVKSIWNRLTRKEPPLDPIVPVDNPSDIASVSDLVPIPPLEEVIYVIDDFEMETIVEGVEGVEGVVKVEEEVIKVEEVKVEEVKVEEVKVEEVKVEEVKVEEVKVEEEVKKPKKTKKLKNM